MSRRPLLLSSLVGLLAVVLPAGLVALPMRVTPPASAATCTGTHWIGGWRAVPTDATADQPLVEQTVRVQVVPHRGGRVSRLRLSNRFGTSPVTIGRVSLGLAATAPAIVPGSLRRVTFGGSGSFAIPAGRDVVSDPVSLRFRPFQVLLASVYVVGTTGPVTQHVMATQTSWQSPPGTGNVAGNLDGSSFPLATPLPGVTPAVPQNVAFATGLDVRAPKRIGSVVAFGDSITDGFQGTIGPVVPAPDQIDRNTRYPDWLARRVLAAGRPVSVVNAGISGNQLLTAGSYPIFGPAGLRRFGPDALDTPGVTTVLLLEGINDIGQSSATRDELVAGYRRAISLAHQRGLRIVLGTLTPDEGTRQPGYGADGEATRVEVNHWVRHQGLSDGIVDFDRAVRDPDHPARIRPAYDGGDHLHFNAAGYRAMARAVPLRLLTARPCR